MERPFADKRPIGPFAQRGGVNQVLITTDFTIHKVKMADGSMEPDPTLKNQKMNLANLVEEVAELMFFGHVEDVRVEDHAVDGDDGIRVVYNTEVNATFKNNIDEFENEIKNRLSTGDEPNKFGKITVVAT